MPLEESFGYSCLVQETDDIHLVVLFVFFSTCLQKLSQGRKKTLSFVSFKGIK